MKLNHYLKIFLILFFSFLVSYFSINNIFLANSPKIRPNLDGYFLAKINVVKENILAKLSFNFNLFPSFNQSSSNSFAENQISNQTIDFLKESLKPVTKGVSAATKKNYSYTEFRLNEIEWVQITYTLSNGKQMTIQYPKGTNPPPKEIYEN